MDHLDQLRQRIRRLDAAILTLISERLELAVEIGAEKRDAGIPLRDYAVEKNVLARAASTAGDLGVQPELARAVTQLLIEEACRVQEERHYSSYAGDAERILVVGGRGQMGRWFARFFANQGHRVLVYDPQAGVDDFETASSLAAGLAQASLAVVATPLRSVAGVLEEIVDLGFAGTVFDIASLKGHLAPTFARLRQRGIAATSLHPMFGPGALILSDKVICLCDTGAPEATARVEALFRDTAATLVRLSLEEHDRIAAYVLGASHLVNLLFARVLEQSGLPLEVLEQVGSTTFHGQMATTATVVRNDPEMYFDIQRLNPDTPQVHAAFARALADWTRAVESGDGAAFATAMVAARGWAER